MFRYLNDNNFYCANVDTYTDVVKLWKKVNGVSTVIGEVPQTIVKGTYYNLRVVANRISIKVYVNDNLIIHVTDGDLTSGKVGLNTWLADCYFKNITISQTGGYNYFGKIATQNASISQSGNTFSVDNLVNGGDAFVIGDADAVNITISGDICLSSVGAGSFVVRYTDSNNFYCINIDSEFNVIKVWKKVNGTATIIAQYSTTINVGESYNLKVQLNGSNIKVYLNSNLVLECTDNSLSSGKIGLNSWITDFTIKNIKASA